MYSCWTLPPGERRAVVEQVPNNVKVMSITLPPYLGGVVKEARSIPFCDVQTVKGARLEKRRRKGELHHRRISKIYRYRGILVCTGRPRFTMNVCSILKRPDLSICFLFSSSVLDQTPPRETRDSINQHGQCDKQHRENAPHPRNERHL